MILRRIAHASPEYFAALDLRRKVLRWPLGLEYSKQDIADEANDLHLVGFEDAEPDQSEAIACLLLRPHGESLKMRQVAVAESHQNRGLGRLLVAASETWAKELGVAEIELHARETAVPFYERLGYQAEGETFTEVGIPHRFMRKNLR
jgi:predicted GNAT family N-acyltransferase